MASRSARVSGATSRPFLPSIDAGALVRWPASQIRWKIILPYAVLIVLAAAGTCLSTSLLQTSLNERFENQLVEASRVGSETVVRTEDSHLSIARSVAFTRGLPQAIESGDTATIRDVITALAMNNAVERIDVLNVTGARVACT